MKEVLGTEARIAWAILCGAMSEGLLREPPAPYGDTDRLDLLSARELMDLLEKVQAELKERGYEDLQEEVPSPHFLRISQEYRIYMDDLGEIALQPLQKTVFIFLLKHPEGLRLKERAVFRSEFLEIYRRICPYQDQETAHRRIVALLAPESNTFSEKLSGLNRRLEQILGSDANAYQVYGSNGHPRRIPLDPMYVVWE